MWPWDVARKHSVGVMGWLRACRWAYTEGACVLYEANVFHMVGPEVVGNLLKMLPEASLAAIKRVQLVWEELSPWAETSLRDTQSARSDAVMKSRPGMRGFLDALEAVTRTVPNLQFLYISMSGKLVSSGAMGDNQSIYTQLNTILEHVDHVVAKMQQDGRLVDCRIALPTSCYGTLKLKAAGRWVQSAYDNNHCEPEAVWRSIRGGAGETQLGISDEGIRFRAEEGGRNVMNLEVSDNKVGELGYWLLHGKPDMPTPSIGYL